MTSVLIDKNTEIVSDVIETEFPGCQIHIEPGENQYREYIGFRITPRNIAIEELGHKLFDLYPKINSRLNDPDFEYLIELGNES